MDFNIFVTRGLGDNSYLVGSGKEAFIVDPQRDAWRFLKSAESKGLKIKYVFETHVHNDYISGMMEIQKKTKATLALPEKGDYKFDYLGMADGDNVTVGTLEIEAMETPGHTYEHTSWMVKDQDTGRVLSIFSGGSLIVGSAGRTDLLGNDHTEILTRYQFETMQKYQTFADDVQILPTHGSGSFCTSSNPSQVKVSTIGTERKSNSVFNSYNYNEFLNKVLTGLLDYPTYYKNMAPINRNGPEVFGELELPKKLSKSKFKQDYKKGIKIIDTRDRKEYAKNHFTDSLNIELLASFCSYVGWLVPFNDPIMLIVGDPEDTNLMEAVTQLFRIGYTNITGYLPNSTDFKSVGIPTSSNDIISYKDYCELKSKKKLPYLLDVRQTVEFDTQGRLENSKNVFVGDLMDKIDELTKELKDKEVITYCQSGQRSAIASSILSMKGIKVKNIIDGGIDQLLKC